MRRLSCLGLLAAGAAWGQGNLGSTQGVRLDRPFSMGGAYRAFVQTPAVGGEKNGGVESITLARAETLMVFVNFSALIVATPSAVIDCGSTPGECITTIQLALDTLPLWRDGLEKTMSCVKTFARHPGAQALAAGLPERPDPYAAFDGVRLDVHKLPQDATPEQRFVAEGLSMFQEYLMTERCSHWTENSIDRSERYRSWSDGPGRQ